MPTLNENKYQTLTDAGYSGTLNEMETQWLLAETGAAPPITLNELYHLWFDSKGAPPGSWNERFFWWLEQQGYEGTLSEKLWQAWGGGGAAKYVATNIQYALGGNLLIVYTSDNVGASTGAGFTMTIDGVGTPLVYQNFDGTSLFFTVSETFQPGQVVFVSYSAGDTESVGGSPLTDFTDTKASPTSGEYAFAAAGSYNYLTDGAVNNFVFLDQAAGVGTPTFTTPNGLLLPDHEGVYYGLKSGEAPVYGARRVSNRLIDSGDFTSAVWTTITAGVGEINVTPNYAADPNGGNGACRLEIMNTPQSGSNYALLRNTSERHTGTCCLSVWMKSNDQNTYTVGLAFANRTADPQAGQCEVTPQWQRFSVISDAVNLDMDIGAWNAANGSSSPMIDVLVYAPQFEIDYGITVPSEYIETSGAARTLYFTNANGNTLNGRIVTEAVGAPLAEQPSLYAAPELTNSNIWSNDATNWTLVTGTGVSSYDQIGITGEPNTASFVSDTDVTARTQFRGPSISGASVNGEPITIRYFIKKGSAAYFCRIGHFDEAGRDYRAYFNSGTGAVGATQDLDAVEVVDAGDWWDVYVQGTYTADNRSPKAEMTPAAGTTGTSDDSATVGDQIFTAVEIHLNKTIAQVKGSAPIVTAGSAVTNGVVQSRFDGGSVPAVAGGMAVYGETLGLFPPTTETRYSNLAMMEMDAATRRLLAWRQNSPTEWGLWARGTINQTFVSNLGSGYVEGTWYKAGSAEDETQWSARSDISVWRDAIPAGDRNTTIVVGGGSRVQNYRNLRIYSLPYADAKAKIDELMTAQLDVAPPDIAGNLLLKYNDITAPEWDLAGQSCTYVGDGWWRYQISDGGGTTRSLVQFFDIGGTNLGDQYEIQAQFRLKSATGDDYRLALAEYDNTVWQGATTSDLDFIPADSGTVYTVTCSHVVSSADTDRMRFAIQFVNPTDNNWYVEFRSPYAQFVGNDS